MGAAPKLKDALKFELEIIKGPHAGQKLSFAKGSVTIGRGPENEVVLANDPRVSRKHAEIKQRDHDFVIVNLSDKNVVSLNGQNVQMEIIKKGNVISVGETEIRFHCEASVESLPPVPNISPSRQGLQANPGPVMGMPQPPVPTGFPPMPAGHSVPSYPAAAPISGVPQGYPGAPSARPVGGSSTGGTRSVSQSGGGMDPKVRFWGIVVIIGLVGWFLLSPSKKKQIKDPNEIRSSTISQLDVAEADKRTQELLVLKKEKYDSVQYRRAQENFVRGFRDFQQGQYARARESFQVVLNFDPENELAKRYLHLAQLKFDELVKFNMIQGNRYREKRNWRMCQSNYTNVLTMLQNRREDPTFKEAKQFYEECTLNIEGRY